MSFDDRRPPDFITSNEYCMGIAYLASKRSHDPVTRVGACVVNKDKQIVGIGYNYLPNASEELWAVKKEIVVHAERNAILNRNSADLENCTIYVTLHPCDNCAELIIKSRIKHVIYSSDAKNGRESNTKAKRLLNAAGVKVSEFKHDHIGQLEVDLYATPYTPKHVPESATSSKRDDDGNGSNI